MYFIILGFPSFPIFTLFLLLCIYFFIFIHIFINFAFQFMHFIRKIVNKPPMLNCMDCSVAAFPALMRVLSLFMVQIPLQTL